MNTSFQKVRLFGLKFLAVIAVVVPTQVTFAIPAGTIDRQEFLFPQGVSTGPDGTYGSWSAPSLDMGSWNFPKVDGELFNPDSDVRVQCWGFGAKGGSSGLSGSTPVSGSGGAGGGYAESTYKFKDIVANIEEKYRTGLYGPMVGFSGTLSGGTYNGGKLSYGMSFVTLKEGPFSNLVVNTTYLSVLSPVGGCGFKSWDAACNSTGSVGTGTVTTPGTNTVTESGTAGQPPSGNVGGAGGIGAGHAYRPSGVSASVGNGGAGASYVSGQTTPGSLGTQWGCVVTTTNSPAGTIAVSSNLPVTWTIAGPGGVTSQTTPEDAPLPYKYQELGQYTIVWNIPEGKQIKTQSPTSLQLFDDSTMTFSIEFEDVVTSCPAGYDIDAEGGCSPIQCPFCAEGTAWTGTACAPSECPANEAWDEENLECRGACQVGEIWDEVVDQCVANACRDCQPGYGWTGSYCAPFECPGGQTWKDGKCQVAECPLCPEGYGQTLNSEGEIKCAPLNCPLGQTWSETRKVCVGGGISCGLAHGQIFNTKPTTNLCDDGTTPLVTQTGQVYSWSCGSDNCVAATITTVGDPICDSRENTCRSGTFSDVGDSDTEFKWRCESGEKAVACSLPKNPVCDNDSKCEVGENLLNCSKDCRPKWLQF